ncbi:MAG: hypothetical protein PSU94_05215 [Lacunisphaera sp.]|nr:hypothetical protein [Lacunisphaera sp.]
MNIFPRFPAWLGLGSVALAALLLLCGAGQPPSRMQYRTFLRGNLQARGPIQPNGEARFVSLVIGQPQKPLDATMPFFVRLGSGKVLEFADFTVDRIAGLAGPSKLVLEKSDWGRGTVVEYSLEGMVFVFRAEQCVMFRASVIQLPNRTYAPEIGSAQSLAFYKLPLTQAQLELIFGPPDEIRDKSSL